MCYVRFIVGVENAAAAGNVTLDFDDGSSAPLTLGNASSLTVSDQIPYTWNVAEVKHTYTQPRNYSVTLTIGSRVNERWAVLSNTRVSPFSVITSAKGKCKFSSASASE